MGKFAKTIASVQFHKKLQTFDRIYDIVITSFDLPALFRIIYFIFDHHHHPPSYNHDSRSAVTNDLNGRIK